jgi:hypothetical protein
LEIHILDEEELLLPIYTSRVDAPQGGSPEIFFNEHRKIREYVQLFKAEFANLFAATDLDRAIIFLLDSETTFKRLMVHHDRREEKFLYPLLDEVTTDSERGEIFARLGVMPCTTRDREERLGRVPDWSASVLACKG